MLLHPRLGEEENAVAEGGDRLAVAVEEVEDEPLLAADVARVHSGLSPAPLIRAHPRSEEHTSELQSLMRISYAVFCLKKKKKKRSIEKLKYNSIYQSIID